MKLTFNNACIILEKYLKHNDKQFRHSKRVAVLCYELAQQFNINPDEAAIAGCLHDIGKTYKRQQMLEYCSSKGIPMFDFEIWDNQSALHGKISASLFAEEFAEESETESFKRIRHAIESHVAGVAIEKIEDYDARISPITDLDKILFIADNVEPNKKDYSLISNGKSIQNLNDTIRTIIANKKERANESDRELNPYLDAFLDLLDEEDGRNDER